MCNNITSRDQVGAPLKFFKLAKDTNLKLLTFFSVPKIAPRNTSGTRKQRFPQQKKKPFFKIPFRKSPRMPKKIQLARLLFLNPKSALKVTGAFRPLE